MTDQERNELRRIARLIPGYDPFETAEGCVFVEEKALAAISFIEMCCIHVEGALYGKPFILEDWQKAIVGNIFGWFKPDGHRRYHEVFLFVPRKNGKTPLAAAITNCVLFLDREQGQQNYCAAADREQASHLYRHVVGMIEKEPEMAKRCQVFKSTRAVVRHSDQSFLKVVSAEANTKHGGNSHLVLIDELHAQPNRDLVDVLQTSLASANRKDTIFVHITTSDFDRPSICNEKHDYACKVRDGWKSPDGFRDRAFLPVVYEALPEDDWTDPKVWAKANPNLGVSVSLEYLERECKRAQQSPTYQNTFKRLHLNIRTEQDVCWLDMAKWDACYEDFLLDDVKHLPCWDGLDLSTTTDVTAQVKCFKDPDGNYYLIPYFWIPEARAHERENQDRAFYVTWQRQGHVTMTNGDAVDYAKVKQDIIDRSLETNLQELAADPWNATQILQELEHEEGLPVVMHRQGYASMSGPMKEFEQAVISRKIRHNGNPVLRWMVSNVVADMDAKGNICPNKKKSGGGGRIDGAVAAIMAVGRAAVGSDNTFSEDSVVVG